jgi:hypothetical protein
MSAEWKMAVVMLSAIAASALVRAGDAPSGGTYAFDGRISQAGTPQQEGLRVLFHGNSACMSPGHLEAVVKAAGVSGHVSVSGSM